LRLNARNAGLTVGTVSLVRRQPLEEVGGWAKWCRTEDSERSLPALLPALTACEIAA